MREKQILGPKEPLLGHLTLKEPGFLDPSHSREGGFRPL